MTSPYRIITVCTGNICRSPMAELMIAAAAAERGVDVAVDSAGTTGWEVGSPIDERAGRLLARHGIDSSGHRARQFEQAWFAERDLILALDVDHYEALLALAPDDRAAAKVRMLRGFDPAVVGKPPAQLGIYDPWYGDMRDFEASRQLIQAAIPGILTHARG
ncbi:low molecular weight protein-tyrosine-phosphatase [Specibacter cremeus]|uniref:low molecular weight protein-tyrosine-phosphatase n=1 Tax=Specibacter cremeus TaxID=1629051 RepID=UPI000F7838D4|nr:low molecular weight protein-tyrosine-phosphatase [Specibacter cremeus]